MICLTYATARYFSGSKGFTKHQYAFWHGRHAAFFEQCDDYDHKSEVSLLSAPRLHCFLAMSYFNPEFDTTGFKPLGHQLVSIINIVLEFLTP